MCAELRGSNAEELDRWKAGLMDEIDKAAIAALDKHERLLHLKVMELLLGAMIHRQGIRETRKLLLRYARDLREFHI